MLLIWDQMDSFWSERQYPVVWIETSTPILLKIELKMLSTGWESLDQSYILFHQPCIEIELELQIWDHGQVMDMDANFNYILFLPFSEASNLPFRLGASFGAGLRGLEIEIGPCWP